jgi:hypothetical protein
MNCTVLPVEQMHVFFETVVSRWSQGLLPLIETLLRRTPFDHSGAVGKEEVSAFVSNIWRIGIQQQNNRRTFSKL